MEHNELAGHAGLFTYRFFANIEADRQPGGKEATAWDGYVANVVADAALDSLHHGGRIPVTLNEQPALYR